MHGEEISSLPRTPKGKPCIDVEKLPEGIEVREYNSESLDDLRIMKEEEHSLLHSSHPQFQKKENFSLSD